MDIFKYLGLILFLTGSVIFIFGTDGHVQWVPNEGEVSAFPGLTYSFIATIIMGLLVLAIMVMAIKKIYPVGLISMIIGTFALVHASFVTLNVALDNSEPVTRTILVNNIDKRTSKKEGVFYYALVQSWWDYTRYIPLSISKELYQQITPKQTYLDITVRDGAFGHPYFSQVVISEKTGSPPGLVEFRE